MQIDIGDLVGYNCAKFKWVVCPLNFNITVERKVFIMENFEKTNANTSNIGISVLRISILAVS